MKKVVKTLEKNLTEGAKKQGQILENALHSEDYFHKPLAKAVPEAAPVNQQVADVVDSYLNKQEQKKSQIANQVAKSLNENLDSEVIQQLQNKDQELRKERDQWKESTTASSYVSYPSSPENVQDTQLKQIDMPTQNQQRNSLKRLLDQSELDENLEDHDSNYQKQVNKIANQQ